MKKFVASFVCLFLVLSCFGISPVFALGNDSNEDYLKRINEILKDRNQYVLEDNQEKVMECDKLLDSLDVKEISAEEVIEKNGGKKSRASIPSTKNVSFRITGWITYTYPHNGKKYQIQTLFASPNNSDSILKKYGNYTVNKRNFTASNTKVGVKVVSGAAGYVPVVGPYLSFLQIISDVYGAGKFNSTTTIADASALCSYSLTQTIAYTYVKDYGKTNEKLSLHSNTVDIVLGTQIPSFKTSNGRVYPDVIQRKQKFSIQPSTYNSALHATASFVNGYGNSAQVTNMATFDILSTYYTITWGIQSNPMYRF